MHTSRCSSLRVPRKGSGIEPMAAGAVPRPYLGFVNSVNSYKHVSGPLANVNHMYGPYFGSAALSLFNATVAKG